METGDWTAGRVGDEIESEIERERAGMKCEGREERER